MTADARCVASSENEMGVTSQNKSLFSCHLDFLRGVAALAVLAFHVRYRFFLDYAEVTESNALTKAFYFATSFGHDAVIVFFVLSGYLITTSIVRDCKTQRWSWARYWTNRLTRLYVVLVPGLLLTLCWDHLGLSWFPEATIYTGDQSVGWQHDFFRVEERSSFLTFLGNVVFLQSTWVTPFGSNDPLWSLAFEFWYYVLFATVYAGIVCADGTLRKVLWAGVAMVACLVAGKSILLYFSVWLLGAGLAALPISRRPLSRPLIQLLSVAAFTLFMALMCAGHIQVYRSFIGNSVLLADLGTGIGVALFLFVLRHDETPPSVRYTRTSAMLASISFTLYVVHMPLLVFLRAWLVRNEPWSVTWNHLCCAIALCLTCLVYTVAIWAITEAHTDRVRRAVSQWLVRNKSLQSPPQSIVTTI